MAEGQGIIGALDKYDLDALVMPTFASFYLPAIAGLPVVTVPMGFLPAKAPLSMNPKGNLVNAAPGIPFGLAFVGRRWSEETLISFAYAFEQRTMARKRKKPHTLPMFEIADPIPVTGSLHGDRNIPGLDNCSVQYGSLRGLARRLVSQMASGPLLPQAYCDLASAVSNLVTF